jgi:hypothetical protein
MSYSGGTVPAGDGDRQFRVIDGLTVRLAQSEGRDFHALLLSSWPGSLLAFEPMWARLAAALVTSARQHGRAS